MATMTTGKILAGRERRIIVALAAHWRSADAAAVSAHYLDPGLFFKQRLGGVTECLRGSQRADGDCGVFLFSACLKESEMLNLFII
jgi:hypothetical protein